MSAALALLRRESALAFGRGGGAVQAGGFFVGLAALTPLAGGAEPQRLAAAAPGVAFAALALASLLSLERLFERDLEDGALDLLAVGSAPLEAICAIKCLAQWLAGGLLLSVLAPPVAIALGAPLKAAPAILLAALMASIGFIFTGGVGAALALGSRRGGLLIAVVVLPLYAPPVIFGGAAIQAVIAGLPPAPGFLYLAAYSLVAVALAPFAMAAACRNALD